LAEHWARLVDEIGEGLASEAVEAFGARMSAEVAGAGGRPSPAHPPPVIMDGVHLVQPWAPHHRALAEGRAGTPKIDVVFVHGLRGGAFSTWRPWIPGKPSHDGCWPREWLGSDIPQARLLTVGYRTRLSAWSGPVMPVEGVVEDLMTQMVAAGVGQRPVVFVTHSMGGLLVKELLVKASEDPVLSPLLAATRGVVFYSVPHFGSWLAKAAQAPMLGHMLRPSVTIEGLVREAPHLDELNRRFKELHKGRGIKVTSFSEERATSLIQLPLGAVQAGERLLRV